MMKGDKYLEVDADTWDIVQTGTGTVTFKSEGRKVALVVLSELVAIAPGGMQREQALESALDAGERNVEAAESGSDAIEINPERRQALDRLMETRGSESESSRAG